MAAQNKHNICRSFRPVGDSLVMKKMKNGCILMYAFDKRIATYVTAKYNNKVAALASGGRGRHSLVGFGSL